MGAPDRGEFEEPGPEKVVTVLAVTEAEQDHAWLSDIFNHSNWKILHARTCRDALAILARNRVAVVICDSNLPDGNWQHLLNVLSQTPEQPLLVVASLHADDRLWAEVLNLGGYDVLAKPFDRTEVARSVSTAWLQWKHRICAVQSAGAALRASA